MRGLAVDERVNVKDPPAPAAPSATKKILILWAVIFGFTLLGLLVCMGPLTEFILIHTPQNYTQYAREYLQRGEPQKAAEHLLSVIQFFPPESDTEAFQLLAEAYEELGNEARRDLWRSRAGFQKSWLAQTPQSVEALADRWGQPSELATLAARRMGADLSNLPDSWLNRMTERMFEAKAKEDAPIAEWLAGQTAEQNLGLLLAGGAELVVGESRGFSLPGTALLQSAGFEQGKGALAIVNGNPLIDAQSAGYHVVAFNPTTDEESPPRSFDTYASRAASERMVEYLQSVPSGWVVFLVVSDEASKMADPVLVERALHLVGIELPGFRLKKRFPRYREPFVGIGVKGGKGACLIGDRWGRPAALLALPYQSDGQTAALGKTD